MLCKILRKKDGVDRFHPQYEMFLENPDNSLTFLLSARKMKRSKSSYYTISSYPIDAIGEEGNRVAKVRFVCLIMRWFRSNFIGTHFTVFDNGQRDAQVEDMARHELAIITYDQNILGYNGPRKMAIYMPAMSEEGRPIACTPKLKGQSLISRQTDRHVLRLFNKSPQWNEENQSFVLNFNGRVNLASVKNFQIVHENDCMYLMNSNLDKPTILYCNLGERQKMLFPLIFGIQCLPFKRLA